jgi:predicted acyl esterase
VRRIELPPLEWTRGADGTLEVERKLPNGVTFGARVVPTRDAVRMELWLTNGMQKRVTDLRVQNSVLLRGAKAFAAPTNSNKVFAAPFAACRSADGKRWVITAWESTKRSWGNTACPSLCCDTKFPDCGPGETKRLTGWLSFYEGTDVRAEFRRIEKVVGWGAAGTPAGGRDARTPGRVDLGPVTEKHEMVPMRDGVKLSTYLYLPRGRGPWPVLYEQRYADLRGADTRKALARLAAAGYVVAAQNFRGTHLSEGVWVGYRALGWGDKQDGFDTVEWLAKQRWSTGKVGTFGGSQAGFAQNFLAVAAPPHLVCQYMTDTGLSLFHEGYRIGGTTRPERFKAMEAVCRSAEDNRRLLREWFQHPTYDDYWAQEDCTRHFDKMNVPCFTVGSWYDFMCVGSVESFIGRQHKGGPNSRDKQRLLIGPWLHGGSKNTNKVGDLAYPENARFDQEAHMVRWFDRYLKGAANGVEKDPVVRYYVMGAVGEKGAPGNQWRTAPDWPVPAPDTPYYLAGGASLTTQAPAEETSETTFLADPRNPNAIPGRAFPGARDACDFEKQAQVRTFTSEALTEPVEWTGKVRAELYVSSTARDTDFIVRVSDVYPDGRSVLLMDYVRRARYRDGYDREVQMELDRVYKVDFDVGWTSQVFNRGHRIRVTVASTGAPFYEPNPNTGEPLTAAQTTRTVVAKNTLHHDRRYPSRVVAPVRPPASPGEGGGR